MDIPTACALALILFSIIFPTIKSQVIQAALSDKELDSFLSRLYIDDDQKPSPHQVQLNFQNQVNQTNLSDVASKKFFTFVDPSLFQRPIYRQFLNLLDTYSIAGIQKYQLSHSIIRGTQIQLFLDEFFKTTVFNKTFNFLKSRGHPEATTPAVFLAALKSVWFTEYFRYKRKYETSSFQHVFVGEILRKRRKTGRASGMHNWIRFYILEKTGRVDYAGYILKRTNLAIIAYRLDNIWEKMGGFMLGTSPAFDFAAFTICFWLRPYPKYCTFTFNKCPVKLRNYSMKRNDRTYIGTIFPTPGKFRAVCRRETERV